MVIGLLLGIVIGLLIGPVLRSWLAWREYVEASREADLHEDLLQRMARSTLPGDGEADGSVRTG
jgi:hypothetical protein